MKIDTGSIDGFDSMTAEQKVEALTNMDLPEADHSGYVKKEVFDKKASEAADLSRKLKAKMSDDEKAEADRQAALNGLQEELENIRTENASLKRAQSVAETSASLIGLGYQRDLAAKAAEALVDGDIKKVLQHQEEFSKVLEKKLRAELVMQTPTPPSANGKMETEEISIAKRAGQARAKAQKTSNDVLKHYL